MVNRAMPYFPGTPRSLPQMHVRYLRPVNSESLKTLNSFLRSSLVPHRPGGFRKLVIGLSGGIDSSTVLGLAVHAVGERRVTAVTVDLELPGHAEQVDLARSVAEELGAEHVTLNGKKVRASLASTVPGNGPFRDINLTTRTIHSLIFQYADSSEAAVVSCTDRSELLLSRHMEFFYGHIAPLANHYKTEVFALARALRIPDRVISREPGCVEAWLDSEVFGASYEVLDPILYLMSERGLDSEKIQRRYGGDVRWLRALEGRLAQREWRMVTREPPLEPGDSRSLRNDRGA
jgi:NAD+ synthase